MPTNMPLRTLIVAAAAVVALPASAYSWEATRLPGSGLFSTEVADMNNARQIVGSTWLPDGARHAFLYENGSMRDLGVIASGRDSGALGINNAGQIVGWSQTGELDDTGRQISRAYLYDHGVATRLEGMTQASDINDVGIVVGRNYSSAAVYNLNTQQVQWRGPRAALSSATHVNNAGQVIGSYDDFLGDDGHGFLHDLGSNTTTRLQPPGYSLGYAGGINEAGAIVGAVSNGPFSSTAFYYYNGEYTLYNSPFGLRSSASDINNLGQIAGSLEISRDSEFSIWHAFFYDKGMLVDLNDVLDLPGDEYLRDVIALNDNGDLVVSSSLWNTYLLTATTTAAPVPEPETWAMLLGGLGVTGWAKRRRQRRGA